LLQRSELPEGCRFAPRCDLAEAACFAERQVLAPVGPEHAVACRRADVVAALPLPGTEGPAAARPRPDAESLLDVGELDVAYLFRRARPFAPRVPLPVVRDVSFDVRPGETFRLVGESGSGT